ncbi:MAG: hypothetical protein ACT4RN_06780 [Pseudonocardia sp.]
MEVVDARGCRAMEEARHHAFGALRHVLVLAGVTALAVWFAVAGLPGVASGLVWFVAGVAGGDLLTASGSAVRAWREVRRLGRCAACRSAAADEDEAYGRGRRCARAGHRQVTR